MSRLAPTLFVGLGGSGIQVLRWIKTAIETDPQLDGAAEPVTFLGIDFDAKSNPELDGVVALGPMEFQYLDPSSIAACVNSLDRERRTEGNDDTQRWEFPEILEWYPDPEQRVIKYAQSEATGAAQWRPLGRIGFFLKDREIHSLLTEALTELDRRRGPAAAPGEQPLVILVSSISGGTGSALLFDIAVAIRKIRRNVSVRTYLMLPEIFEHIPFRDRIYSNAYATLWEIANLKNQHVIFNARYPRIPPVTESDSPPPFQRVYLLGPWMGDRRPFLQPSEAYPHIGDLLRLAITKEIRSAALTSEANATADAAAPLNSSTSKDVFCTVSAMGIRLINYRELADLAVRAFLDELEPRRNREFIELFTDAPEVDNLDLLRWIEDAATGNDKQYTIDGPLLETEIGDLFSSHTAYRRHWEPHHLQTLLTEARQLIGTDPSIPLTEPPRVTRAVAKAFATALLKKLGELEISMAASPRTFELYLSELRGRLNERPTRDRLQDLENVENFERWLRGGEWWGTLPQLLTPPHVDRLRAEVKRWAELVPKPEHFKNWLAQAVWNAARETVDELLREQDQKWSAVEAARKVVNEILSLGIERDRANEHILLDGREARAAIVLRHETERLRADRKAFVLGNFLTIFQTHYDDYLHSGAKDARILERWIDRTRSLFEQELSIIDHHEDRDARGTRYSLLSPQALFTDEQITSAILRCATRVFQPGRVSSKASIRIARLMVPAGFRHRHTFYEEIRGWCRALLGASASPLPDTGNDREKRVIVVLEDLFHPAEDLAGIYDYHSDYTGQPDPLMFHIHKSWPSLFAPLVTSAGNRGRVSCGNIGCKAEIKSLDRAALFCPDCALPIRNRCGNRGCLMDDLQSRPNLRQIIDSKTCPSCHRFLHTYWWTCPAHGDVPIDKETCPTCVRTGGPDGKISVRPDREDQFRCPTCVKRRLARPFAASGNTARFLRDGVNHHDFVEADRVFASAMVRGTHCRMCGTHLVPTCPVVDSPDERPHYLYRHREGDQIDRFRCYRHIDVHFYGCSVCDFPVQRGDSRCRRCGTDLADCRWCTPTLGKRIPKSALQAAHASCPSCHLNPKTEDVLTSERPDPDELFCSNLFACPAGGRLDEVSFPPRTHRCPLCSNRELPLLHVHTRDKHIGACAYCSTLFSRDFTRSEGPPSPTKEPNRELVTAEPCPKATTAEAQEPVCCLCGFELHASEALWKDQDKTDALRDTFRAFQEIGTALRRFPGDMEAFRYLLDCLPGGADFYEDYLRCFLDRIQRDAVRHAITPRLQRLLDLYHAQFGCRRPPATGQNCHCKS